MPASIINPSPLLKQLLEYDHVLAETEHMFLRDQVVMQSKLLVSWTVIQTEIKLGV